jgi:hypothetical protein
LERSVSDDVSKLWERRAALLAHRRGLRDETALDLNNKDIKAIDLQIASLPNTPNRAAAMILSSLNFYGSYNVKQMRKKDERNMAQIALTALRPELSGPIADEVDQFITEMPDSELRALGIQFEYWSAQLHEPKADAAIDQKLALICERIRELRATTFEGLRVKARVARWAGAGEDGQLVDDETDLRNPQIAFAESILRDLLAS